MSVTQISRLIGDGTKDTVRKPKDFYPTPTEAINVILEREEFEGDIWEPACGDGAISKHLKIYYKDVFSSDIHDYGYPMERKGDFLKITDKIVDNIVTNPPFNISTEFTLHALECSRKKVAIFNKLTFLEGKARREKLFSRHLLKTVYIFSGRLGFGEYSSGMMAFAWFVFDKEFYGDPVIKWV